MPCCAFRKGLDVADTQSFPELQYGQASKSNTQRHIEIANSFREYGAKQVDPEKAAGGGMINRRRQDYNDAGCKILPGNYQRHLTRIEPEEMCVAWWSIDKSIYDRFARGFGAEKGKNSIYFDLDDNFFAGNRNNEKNRIKIKVIYNSNDSGSW